MNSTYQMQMAEQRLYEIIASRSRVQLQQWGTFEPRKYSTIIVFERLDLDTLYVYGYDSVCSNVILLSHFEVGQFIQNLPLYYQQIQKFLTSILLINSQAIIHFINFGEFTILDPQSKLEYAHKLLDTATPQSKIIVQISGLYQEIQNMQENFLLTQVSLNQFALLKVEQDIQKYIIEYEKFTKKQLKQCEDVHKEFKNLLELSEKQVVLFNFYNLIKSITKQKDLPNLIHYHAAILINLSKFTQQQPPSFIPTLREYRLTMNEIDQQINGVEKFKMSEIIAILPPELALFKDEKYSHFPMKQTNSQKCKVCLKKQNQKVHKSNFKCESCCKYYKINITLCTVKCFKLFHINPAYYLRRKSRRNNVKVKEE